MTDTYIYGESLDQTNSTSYPDDNPKTVYGEMKPPLEFIPPSAIIALGLAMEVGAKKYGAMNWRLKTVSSSVYYNAALRHMLAFWDGEHTDPESGVGHLAHAMACLAIIIDASGLGRLNDNRPHKGKASALLQELRQMRESVAKRDGSSE